MSPEPWMRTDSPGRIDTGVRLAELLDLEPGTRDAVPSELTYDNKVPDRANKWVPQPVYRRGARVPGEGGHRHRVDRSNGRVCTWAYTSAPASRGAGAGAPRADPHDSAPRRPSVSRCAFGRATRSPARGRRRGSGVAPLVATRSPPDPSQPLPGRSRHRTESSTHRLGLQGQHGRPRPHVIAPVVAHQPELGTGGPSTVVNPMVTAGTYTPQVAAKPTFR
jgi:hypothetical protein